MEDTRKKIKYIMLESFFTAGGLGLSLPILTEFWNGCGMNQELIGLSQMICSIASLILSYPLGYIADKYDRRLLNVLGDLGMSIVFLLYAFCKSFVGVLICEFLAGVFLAMSEGVDSSLLKYYSDKLDKEQNSKDSFQKFNSRMSTNSFISLMLFLVLGMFVAMIDIRLNMALVFVPNIIGTIFGFMVPDIGDRLTNEEGDSSIKTIFKTTKYLTNHPKKIWYLIAVSWANKVTHPVIWVLTPLLIMAGVPTYIVALGWIMNYGAPILGSIFARKFKDSKFSTKFLLPFITVGISSLILIINTNIFTVWLFSLVGFSRGYTKVLLIPELQKGTLDKYQTSLISLLDTVSRIIYIPAVYIINYFGNDNPINSLKVNLIFFIPVALLIYIFIRKYDKREA